MAKQDAGDGDRTPTVESGNVMAAHRDSLHFLHHVKSAGDLEKRSEKLTNHAAPLFADLNQEFPGRIVQSQPGKPFAVDFY